MAPILLPMLMLLLTVACSGPRGGTQTRALSSQETYEYGSCTKARDDCPHERTLECALETIASKYNACSKNEDCVAATIAPKCSEAGTCPPLYVNREMKGAFQAEAQKEVDRYCENANCQSSGLCGITRFEAGCENARCVWQRKPFYPFEEPPH